MASIAAAVGCIKAELGQALAPEQITRACRAVGLRWRQRVLDPVTTVYVFILQLVHGNTAMSNLPRLSGVPFTPAAYCQARQRLPLDVLRRLLRATAQPLAATPGNAERWCGHRTLLVDGSSCSMPDTRALRRRFGLPPGQKPGCGFPVAHLLYLFEAASGAVLDVLISPWHTHDLRRLAELFGHLQPGDVLVGDRGFCAYAQVAWLFAHQVLVVFRMRQQQIVDFRPQRPYAARGRGLPKSRWVASLAPQDQLVMWFRPQRPSHTLTAAEHAQTPAALVVRELRYRVRQRGFRTRAVTLVTTLLDPQRYPAEKLAELYRMRWQVETHLRELKCTLGLSVLHSKTVAGVEKEICVFGLVYNLVRAVIQQAAARQGVPIERVSFTDALRSLRCRLHPPSPPGALDKLQCFAVRPDRYEPRYRKRRPPSYPLMTRPRAVLRREMRNRPDAA
jgi:Transposase DDE domain